MFVINSPGPVPVQCVTKRLGFSGSFKRGTDNLLDEIIDRRESDEAGVAIKRVTTVERRASA